MRTTRIRPAKSGTPSGHGGIGDHRSSPCRGRTELPTGDLGWVSRSSVTEPSGAVRRLASVTVLQGRCPGAVLVVAALALAALVSAPVSAQASDSPPVPPGPRLTASIGGDKLSLTRAVTVDSGALIQFKVRVAIPAGTVVNELIIGVSPSAPHRVTTDAQTLRSLGIQIIKQSTAPLRGTTTVRVTWRPEQSSSEWLVADFLVHATKPVGESGGGGTLIGKVRVQSTG